ncbi:hypothetical protein ABAC460_18835 [Asticcacaulis sp. AC460]|uniref:tetratricopeptide repeat protein n=1 Tax=Asticcacaulis sp. AC460 TaxID=1282360 RepID=UPI0003C3B2A5|nr:SEL1-like repeat protein [Asticcacaulis sp. AC460]ESQ87731.1 hypothetical protein ABAC460_18835 [Asticcacaulis sp. AC460]
MANTCRTAKHAAMTAVAMIGMVLPMAAHAEWNAANDEANRQRMMNDMQASSARNDRLNFESQQRSTSGYTSSTSSGSSYGSSGSSSSGYSYKPYEYKPEGPHSVVATYTFTVYQQETEAQTIARVTAEAQAGNAQSQYNLGRIYYTGYGVARDMTAARTWFCTAALQDHPPAKAQCAAMMDNGQGGPEDAPLARSYARDAATKGDPYGEALYAFYTIGDRVAAGDMSAPPADILAMAEDAADRGQYVAQYLLGLIVYMPGLGLAPDRDKAMKYLRLASSQKSPDVMNYLAQVLLSSGKAELFEEGVAALQIAADGGLADAQGLMAAVLMNKQDWDGAFRYATLSAKGGDPQGQIVLAKLYYFGYGPTKDMREAARWFKAAADQGFQEAKDAMNEPEIAAAAATL